MIKNEHLFSKISFKQVLLKTLEHCLLFCILFLKTPCNFSSVGI